MTIESLTDKTYIFSKKDMNISEVVECACQEPTLLEALTLVAVWESERIVKQSQIHFKTGNRTPDGAGWETCFRTCFKAIAEAWKNKHSEKENNSLSELVTGEQIK